MSQAIFDGRDFDVVTPSGKQVCNVVFCVDGLFAVTANNVLCFAVQDDFGKLVRVPGSYYGEPVYCDFGWKQYPLH